MTIKLGILFPTKYHKKKKETNHFQKKKTQPFCKRNIPLNNMPLKYTRRFLLVPYVNATSILMKNELKLWNYLYLEAIRWIVWTSNTLVDFMKCQKMNSLLVHNNTWWTFFKLWDQMKSTLFCSLLLACKTNKKIIC
jgi:hypothetical protein